MNTPLSGARHAEAPATTTAYLPALDFTCSRRISLPALVAARIPFLPIPRSSQGGNSRNSGWPVVDVAERASPRYDGTTYVAHKDSSVDFIVLGGGIAGMRAAIELAEGGRGFGSSPKMIFYESSTEYAQGGILPQRWARDDEVTLHLHDTLRAGDGLCREEAVRVLVEEGPQQIHQLIEWGMHFDRNGTKLAFTREGAHSRSRILHAQGDSTGSEILRALMAKARTRFLPPIGNPTLLHTANWCWRTAWCAG